MSAKLMPLAATRILSSPGPGAGSDASRTASTSGGPSRVIHTCRILLLRAGARVPSGDTELPVASGKPRVVCRRLPQVSELLWTERSQHLRRGAEREVSGRDLHARGDERSGADDRVRADLGAIEDDRADADQHTVADRAAVEDGGMADRDVLADPG